jgi:phosphoenolpyruvate phosphomutase
LQNVAQGEKDWILSYGDVLFKKYVLQMLVESIHDLTIVVDADLLQRANRVRPDYVYASLPNSKQAFYSDVYLKQMGSNIPSGICGVWTGLLKVDKQVQQPLFNALKTLLQDQNMKQYGRMPSLITELVTLGYPVHVIYITGNWLDIDEVEDIVKAGSF